MPRLPVDILHYIFLYVQLANVPLFLELGCLPEGVCLLTIGTYEKSVFSTTKSGN